MKIVILEDNSERQQAMRDCLGDRFPHFEIVFFDEAAAAIGYLQDHLEEIAVVGLDHDLEIKTTPEGVLHDPGTGRQVADFLANVKPICPVVVHSSNGPAAFGMEATLRESGWKTFQVAPYGELEWIPAQWFRCMRRAMVGPVEAK
jgi:hypothetical protein